MAAVSDWVAAPGSPGLCRPGKVPCLQPPYCVFVYFILKAVCFKCLQLANQYLWSYKEIDSIITGLEAWLLGEVRGQ